MRAHLQPPQSYPVPGASTVVGAFGSAPQDSDTVQKPVWYQALRRPNPNASASPVRATQSGAAPTGGSAGGATTAAAGSDPRTVTAGGEFAGQVDVGGGRTIYLECHGAGTPTVVLPSGAGNAGDIWQVTGAFPPPVADGVAASTHVCVYDRPGTYVTTVEKNGARVAVTSADPVTAARGNTVVQAPRTGGDVVAELHQLLAAAHVPGPYVLVGHSIGGLFALLYARTYPDQVSGMVLVDRLPPRRGIWSARPSGRSSNAAAWTPASHRSPDTSARPTASGPPSTSSTQPGRCHEFPSPTSPRRSPSRTEGSCPTPGPPRILRPSRRRDRPRTQPSSRASPARN